MKKMPERTCVGCNAKKSKLELIRIVKNKTGEICIDFKYNMEGRGAYICKDLICLEKVMKNKRLERVLKHKIPSEIYEDVRGVIVDKY